MLLFLLIASITWCLSHVWIDSICHQMLVIGAVFVVTKLVLAFVFKVKGWEAIPGDDALYLSETSASPCNVLAFYFLENGDENLVRRNWKETVLSKPEQFSRYMCVVKSLPILGHFFVKSAVPIENNVFLSPDNDEVKTRKDFEKICALRAEEHLSRSKPLYELEVFTNLKDDAEKGSTIVLFRVHHVIGDGAGLSTTLASQTKQGEGIFMVPKRKTKIFPTPVLLLIAIACIHKLIMLLFGRADKNMFHNNMVPSGKRVCALSQLISLDIIKEIRKKHPLTTLNDICMSAVAGSYHRYMMKRFRNDFPNKTEDELLSMLPEHITANMPINMRPQLETCRPKLQNKFTFLFTRLPVASPDRIHRLNKTQRGLKMLKGSMAPIVHFFACKGIMDLLPASLSAWVITFCGNKCTTLLTNVPGPPNEIVLQGKNVESMAFFVPQRGNCAMGISLTTSFGYLRLGVLVDKSYCPDPHTFVDMFEDEIRMLHDPDTIMDGSSFEEKAN